MLEKVQLLFEYWFKWRMSERIHFDRSKSISSSGCFGEAFAGLGTTDKVQRNKLVDQMEESINYTLRYGRRHCDGKNP